MIENFSIRFGRLVDEYRGSATDLAKGLQVSKQTISAWRSGARSPKTPMVEAIARFFDVSIPWLMGLDCPRGRFSEPSEDRIADYDRLEALHRNPRLGLLFDRQRQMSPDAVEAMIQMADLILKERDNE